MNESSSGRVVRRYLLGRGQAEGEYTLPAGHRFGMRVPQGGAACSKCAFLTEDARRCQNTNFVQWRASLGEDSRLPVPADEYCCDVFKSAGSV